jgi:hypothetical protein
MPAVQSDLRVKLPYLLHLGLVELRTLASEQAPHGQIAKLADVLEFLPRYLEPDGDQDEDVVREQFEQYAAEFPRTRFAERYLAIIDGHDTPSAY